MPKVGIITQARTTSTRLPGKVLLKVGGKSLLLHHLERLAVSELPVFVATTVNRSDEPILEIARTAGTSVHRGSEADVLSRFSECATTYDLDVVVRVTSDCPLIDGRLIVQAVEEYLEASDSQLYLSNTLERSFPRGFDFEVFSAAALAEAHAKGIGPDREHVTPYIYNNWTGRMKLRNISWPEDKSSYRITVDTPDDLEVVRTLIEGYGADKMTCAQIIGVLDAHPEIVALNSHVGQKKLGT